MWGGSIPDRGFSNFPGTGQYAHDFPDPEPSGASGDLAFSPAIYGAADRLHREKYNNEVQNPLAKCSARLCKRKGVNSRRPAARVVRSQLSLPVARPSRMMQLRVAQTTIRRRGKCNNDVQNPPARSSRQPVGGRRHARRVLTADLLIEQFDSRALPWGRATGLAGVDEMTRGMVAGQVWVLVGAPGHGRTTLLLQLAARYVDLPGHVVFVDAPRESAEFCVARLLACLGKHPLRPLLAGHLDADEHLISTRQRLAQSGLVFAGAGSSRLASVRDQLLDHSPAAVFVDDLDVIIDATPERVAGWAAKGAFVCISLPRHLVVRDGDLDPAWARVADLVLDVRVPGLLEEDARAPGEADLGVLKNRRGPLRVCRVAFEGHYSRFVDLRT
jgi:hypothetical protein